MFILVEGGGGNFVEADGGGGGGGLLKRFATFSYLNHSFILNLNVKVKVCIRCIVFLQISLIFYLSRVMLDERFVH